MNHPTASLEVITPEIAAAWLAKNTRNRNIRQKDVAQYARDMEAGRWTCNGESIKCAHDETLLDGQHRLMAIIRSGVPIETLVVRGLTYEAQDTMDSGIKRKSADVFAIRGQKNASSVAAAARFLLNIRSGQRSASFSHGEINELVDTTPELLDAVEAVSAYRKKINGRPAVLAVAWLWFHEANPDACVEFFHSIAEHATRGEGDPRNTLIRRLSTAKINRERQLQATELQWFVRAWNAWRRGEQLHVLRDRSASSKAKGGSTVVRIPEVQA